MEIDNADLKVPDDVSECDVLLEELVEVVDQASVHLHQLLRRLLWNISQLSFNSLIMIRLAIFPMSSNLNSSQFNCLGCGTLHLRKELGQI